MLGIDGDLGTIGLGNDELHRFAGRKVLDTASLNDITARDLFIVVLVDERQGQDTLLLQVGLVDTCKRSGNDQRAAEVTDLESGVLASRTFTVVMLFVMSVFKGHSKKTVMHIFAYISDNHPRNVLALVALCDFGDAAVGSLGDIVDNVHLAVVGIESTNQGVLGNVFQVSLVLEPGTSGGNVVSGALALNLDEYSHVLELFAVPCLERFEHLQTVRCGRDDDLYRWVGSRCRRGRFVGCSSSLKALAGQIIALRRLETELVAILVQQGIRHRVEGQLAREGHGGDNLYTCH